MLCTGEEKKYTQGSNEGPATQKMCVETHWHNKYMQEAQEDQKKRKKEKNVKFHQKWRDFLAPVDGH